MEDRRADTEETGSIVRTSVSPSSLELIGMKVSEAMFLDP